MLRGVLHLGIEDNGTVTDLHPRRDRRKNLAAVIAEGTTLRTTPETWIFLTSLLIGAAK
jgi:hypothetical protein